MKEILETKRLLIRQYSIDDLSLLSKILSDPVTMSYWPSPYTIDQTEHWLKRNIESSHLKGYGRWGVELKSNSQLIGDVGIVKSEIDGKSEYDLGYIIHSDYWNQGFAFEAAWSCMEYGLNRLKLSRICANMPSNHMASIRIAEKLGMILEKQYTNERNRNILTNLFVKEKLKI